MFGRKLSLSRLESRKQMLIVESEINRLRLVQEWQTMAAEVGHLTRQAKSFNGLVSSIFSLVGALGVFAGNKPATEPVKSSWLQKLTSGARVASNIWLIFRAQKSNSDK